MADIRPNQLPQADLPISGSDIVIVDQGINGVRKATVSEVASTASPLASQAEAIAGTNNTKTMTPLRVKESIESEIGVSIASNEQGDLADSAVQSVNGKTGNAVTLVKADVGLGNVDNTSDLNKPISTATQTALNLKANDSVVVKSVNGVTPTSGNVNISAEEIRLQDTVASAQAETFTININFIFVSGFSSPGDGGGSLYKRVASEPVHAGKFQSVDGTWWELAENEPSVKMFGSGNAAHNNAVAFALEKGTTLTWSAGDYTSTASIPNFHGVKNIGPGVIKRGAESWYITPPTAATINKVYAAASGGSSGNDGLSATQPIDTFQNAINALVKWAPLLNGQWQVTLAAGTYARGRFPDEGLTSAFPVRVVGPSVGGHPNVPTAIIKEGATQAAFGILSSYMDLYVQDVKIEDYNGSTSSCGIRIDFGRLYAVNTHFEDCYYGAAVLNFSTIDVKGGIFNDCGYLNSDPAQGSGHAIRGVFHTKWEVGLQGAGNLLAGPFIRNCAGAARAQEYADGHWDFVTIEDCTSGLRLLVNSRLNIDGSSFKRITQSAIYTSQGCHTDPTVNTVFGTGADANGRDYTGGFGSTGSGMGISGFTSANSANPGILENSFPNVTVNTTGNTNLSTKTVNINSLNDTQFTQIPTKKLKCRVHGVIGAGVVNTKRLIFRLNASGTNIVIQNFSAATTGNFESEFTVYFRGNNSQFLTAKSSASTVVIPSNLEANESTSASMSINLEGTVLTAGDSITIRSVEWEQTGF